jgi:hypothetical protein
VAASQFQMDFEHVQNLAIRMTAVKQESEHVQNHAISLALPTLTAESRRS